MAKARERVEKAIASRNRSSMFFHPSQLEWRIPTLWSIPPTIIVFLWAGFWAGFWAFWGFSSLFLFMGLRLIPVGWRALAVDMGQQNLERYFNAGWKWYWPSPYGGMLLVNCQKDNLDLTLTEVLTADQVQVTVDASIAFNHGPASDAKEDTPEQRMQIAKMLYNYILVKGGSGDLETNIEGKAGEKDIAKEQLEQEGQEQIRHAIAGVHSSEVQMKHAEYSRADRREGAAFNATTVGQMSEAEKLEEESEEKKKKETLPLKQTIGEQMEGFGINVESVQIVSIRLPPMIEEARAKVQKEAAERDAERIERDGNLEAVDLYMKRGMTANEAFIAHQAERGKSITRNVQTFQGLDLKGLGEGIGLGVASIIEASRGKPSDSSKLPAPVENEGEA